MATDIKLRDLQSFCNRRFARSGGAGRPDWLPDDIPASLLEQATLASLAARSPDHLEQTQLALPADLLDPRKEWVRQLVLQPRD